MDNGDPGRTSYKLEWYDTESELLKPFIMFCYPGGSVELVDVKRGRTFLRRTVCPTVDAANIHIGGVVNVFQRQMEVVDYGDEFTRRLREKEAQRTLAVVKPDAVPRMGKILTMIQENGFGITKLKSVRLIQSQAERLYEQHKGKDFMPALLTHMTSGPVIAIELTASNGVARWKHLMGPTDPEAARRESPCSIRAMYGRDATINSVHGSFSVEEVDRELDLFFPEKPNANAPLSTSTLVPGVTCCVVRPHALEEKGTLGRIVDAIEQNKFKINAIEMFKLNKPNAAEFLEVYESVLPNFNEVVDELSSGPCVAMEIGGFEDETQERFKVVCGPRDPEVGKVLREHTLRARFGTDKVHNAVHCTDLPEDAILECEYFFCLLRRP